MSERRVDGPQTPEILTRESNLAEIDSFLSDIYNERDSIYLSGRSKRIELLDAGIDDLSVAMRKGSTNLKFKEDLIARIISRAFCISRSVAGLSIAEGLSEKFPASGCSYCGMLPCECQDRTRNPYTLSEPTSDQMNWSLNDWQAHLTRMYGDKNIEQGIHFVIGRLSSERRELNSVESLIQEAPEPIGIDAARREFQLELADTMAWTIGAASVIGVNAQDAVVERYGYGCSICRHKPCRCPQGAHNFKSFNGKSYRDVANGEPF